MAPNATRIPFLAEALDINSARFVVGPILISRIGESKRAFPLFLEAVGVRDDC